MRFLKRIKNICDDFLREIPTSLAGNRFRYLLWRNRFNYCGNDVKLSARIIINGFSSIRIGSSTSIMSGSYLYAHDSKGLTIGKSCSFNHNVLIDASGGEIKIGDNVLIGPNVVLRASDHIFSSLEVPIRMQGHSFGSIVIGDDVWIGSNVVVTGGVNIGNGCVVGAGSVVTKDLPPMTLCVGVPSKPIRSRSV